MRRVSAWIAAIFLTMFGEILRADQNCEVCGTPIVGTIYLWEDKVDNVNRRLCHKCTEIPASCYMCSLPVARDYTELPDGRVLCARDAKTVVLKEEEALKICEETRQAMHGLFSRFMDFPDTNVTISLVDRINLINLFKFPGRDYQCPNVMGYIHSKTNGGAMTHEISLMSGLPRVTVKSTLVHECAHAWVAENVPSDRRESLKRDAEEGFCELVSYMLMDFQGEEDGKKAIKLNGYTRGQIDLFIEAEKRFGFNDILDWMKHGTDDQLQEDDLVRVRAVEIPVVKSSRQTNAVAASVPTKPVEMPAPAALVLKGITWAARPMALINDHNFQLQEQSKVRVGTNTITIRCLAIREGSVLIQNIHTGEKLELKLKAE